MTNETMILSHYYNRSCDVIKAYPARPTRKWDHQVWIDTDREVNMREPAR